MPRKKNALVPVEQIEKLIHTFRRHKVMLDADLADLYGVTTKALNQAVKRNADRFAEDFVFQLNRIEAGSLNRSQFVTGPRKHRDPRSLPYAFTQEGVSALSGVLRSARAAQVFVYVMRAFVRQRALLARYPEILLRLEHLEKGLAKNDEKLQALIDALREDLLDEEEKPSRPIGFRSRLAPPDEK